MIRVQKISGMEGLQAVRDIRTQVFIIGQGCPPELEWEHEEESVHFLAYCDGLPCGTARWRQTGGGYKLERFAVLEEFRGRGLGKALLEALMADLPRQARNVYLNAQVSAIGFYAQYGFIPVGDLFEEAGIMHRKMEYRAGRRETGDLDTKTTQ